MGAAAASVGFLAGAVGVAAHVGGAGPARVARPPIGAAAGVPLRRGGSGADVLAVDGAAGAPADPPEVRDRSVVAEAVAGAGADAGAGRWMGPGLPCRPVLGPRCRRVPTRVAVAARRAETLDLSIGEAAPVDDVAKPAVAQVGPAVPRTVRARAATVPLAETVVALLAPVEGVRVVAPPGRRVAARAPAAVELARVAPVLARVQVWRCRRVGGVTRT